MILKIFFLLILIFINGILSASEIAFLSLNKYSLTRKRNKKAKKIEKAIENESTFLSTIQIGITLAGFLASAFASDTFTEYLIDYGVYIISDNFTKTFLMITITLILSYITLVFGELVPKKIGRSKPEKVAYLTIDLITTISFIFKPLILLLTASTNFICNLLNIHEREETLTTKDIKKLIITGSKQGIVEEREKEYILNIFNFNNKTANRIMTPREKVIYIDIKDNKRQVLKKIRNSKFTRFPVLDDEKILGFINIKDFIYYHQDNKNLKIKDIIHPACIFKKSEKIDDIFRIMQENHETFSIITDKNLFIGILTIEDAVEEIVGNIEDEYSQKTD